MARYYFDTFDGVERIRDESGLDLPHREAARRVAQEAMPAIVRDGMPDGMRRDFIVDVRDAMGIVIYTCTMTFSGRWLDHSAPPLGNRG